MSQPDNELFGNVEEIANWTYPGATLYYKDCDLTPEVTALFKPDQILRNGYFLDVSCLGGGLFHNTRFLIASSKAANLHAVNPDNAKYGHCCINANSYFKVLDVHTVGDKTQIFLLHIPAAGIKYFSRVVSNVDEKFIAIARKGFEEKLTQEPLQDLLDPFWAERTNFPAGMDAHNRFYPLSEITTLPPEGQMLYEGIRKLTRDTGELNVPKPFLG